MNTRMFTSHGAVRRIPTGAPWNAYMAGRYKEAAFMNLREARDSKDKESRAMFVKFARTNHRKAMDFLREMQVQS